MKIKMTKSAMKNYASLFLVSSMLCNAISPTVALATVENVSEVSATSLNAEIVTPDNLLSNPEVMMENGKFPGWTMKYSNSHIGTLVLAELLQENSDGYYVMGDKVWITGYQNGSEGGGFTIASNTGAYSAGCLEQEVYLKKGQTYSVTFDVREFGGAPLSSPSSSKLIYSFGQGDEEAKIETINYSNQFSTKTLTYTAKEDGNANLSLQAYNNWGGIYGQITSRLRIEKIKVINTDVTAPVKPTIRTVVDTTSTVIQGVGEPDTEITITSSEGELVTGQTDAIGEFMFEIPRQVAGTVLLVRNKDFAGNISEPRDVLVRQGKLDKPQVEPVTNTATQVVGTADRQVTVIATIDKIDGSQKQYYAESQNDGSYVVPIQTPEFGESIGLHSEANGFRSDKETVKVSDVIHPEKPELTVISNEDSEIKGYGLSGNTIKVTLPNGDEVTTKVLKDNSFILEIPKQEIGTVVKAVQIKPSGLVSEEASMVVTRTSIVMPKVNKLTDKSTNINGNGEPNADVNIVLKDKDDQETDKLIGATNSQGDFTVPVKSLENIAQVDVYLTKEGLTSPVTIVPVEDTTPPEIPLVFDITKDDTVIKGTAEPESIVRATVEGKVIGEATATKEGEFSIPIAKQGTNTIIKVTATDQANNSSDAAEVVVGEIYLASPILEEVTNTSTILKGSALASARITIDVKNVAGDNIEFYEGNADSKGQFSFLLRNRLDVGSKVELRASKDGVFSHVVTEIVKDVIAPEAPVVNPILVIDKEISGTTEGGSLVKAFVENLEIGSTIAEKDGSFVMAIEPLEAGTDVLISATDSANNQSEFTTVEVQELIGDILVEDYVIGSNLIKGSYNGAVSKARLKVNDKVISWGGAFKNQQFSYYVSSGRIKEGDKVQLEAFAKNETLLDLKEVKVVVVAEGQVEKASHILGSNLITGNYKDDVSLIRLIINDKPVSWGGQFKDGVFCYYVKSGQIKEEDKVTLNTYDRYGSLLQENVSVSLSKATGEIKTANYLLGDTTIKGTYAGNIALAKLTINDQVVSWGGDFKDGEFTYYVSPKRMKDDDVVVLSCYDHVGNLLSENHIVSISVPDSQLTEARYVLGGSIQGTYSGLVSKGRLFVNGRAVSWGGSFKQGQFTYYVAPGVIKAGDEVKVNGYGADDQLLTEDLLVTVSEQGINNAVYKLGAPTITGTYVGTMTRARLSHNDRVVSWGGNYHDGQFSYYINPTLVKAGDQLTLDSYDEKGELLSEKLWVTFK
ncbi:immunoglobulin-like domain-containing protein [uncultured Vagococcus sp.]|uniref:immunoglobulin-like domain-containing protein n=1 Tax=uncultured Vagococcus sp. TaxID=189676 RepID=UPI0028D79753|nr:immunoglobulin-like domain-containing protein [uncultured Vagococcus sp.]